MNNEPWPHMVIDSYYPPELFLAMRKEIVAYLGSNPSKFSNARQVFFRSTDYDFSTTFPHTFLCVNSVSPYKMLEHFKEHRPYVKMSHYNEINVIVDGHDYPIHDENPRKIFSIVNYITPENSTGTLIYDTDKNFHSEVKWKPNRTLAFAGITDKTWHSYKVEPKKIRISVNTFLVDDLA